ncbi:MAG TPA: TolC family protein [Acidobacteriaceae bacterium]|nr:TolC family protein [Acidobacteriaceae bacterium]
MTLCIRNAVRLSVLCAVSSAFCFAQTTTPNAPPPAGPPPPPTIAQQAQAQAHQPLAPAQPFQVTMPHSHNPLSPYRPANAPALNLSNSPRLYDLMRDGKLYLALRDAIALAIENNLDIAYFRYNFPIAQTDLLNTKAGGVVGGVNTNIVQSAQGGFGSSAGGGSSSGGLSAAGAGGIVTSALGAGSTVPSFDPYLTFKGSVDHTRLQQLTVFQEGVPVLENNTIQASGSFSQSYPLGTNLYIQYSGQRLTSNSPYDVVNPELQAYYLAEITQPLLYGFGLASNERYIHIAKRNVNITNYAFEAQVIAIITQVEDIYWDLADAYQDEQIEERSLDFANQTLSDDQKQLDLKAIPALQVMQDETAVATAEGNLTVARANLRLYELQLKNVLTKTDDATIDAMPVIPLDLKGQPDPNADKPIDQLIAEAEKNRPEVHIYQEQAEIQKANLKSANNVLLPTLNMYGFYLGAGLGGPKNPYCDLGTAANGINECATTLPTGFGGMFDDEFNYSSPEYQVGMTLSINLRNRVAKATQFRAALQYRQSQITYEENAKNIRFDVRNSQFALEQAQARVQAAQQARDLAQRTFDITKQEQQLGAKSSYDVLVAENALATAEATLDDAQAKYEEAKVDLDRATGETLQLTGVSVDDAKTGVVTHMP